MPTYHEGIPTTILEAMYFGGAIVSGNAGFISYQLDDGACGLLFKGGDVAALREHLQQLMASPQLRDAVHAARQGAHGQYVRLGALFPGHRGSL